MLKVSESYIIGIDISPDGDESTLTVAQHVGSRLNLINVFYGQEAENIYNKLTNNKLERGNK